MIVKSKNKTDKKDAERIAKEAVKQGLPERIVIPEEGEKQLRDLLNEREGQKKTLTAQVNRLHALTVSEGLAIKKGQLTEEAESWDRVCLLTRNRATAKQLTILMLIHMIPFLHIPGQFGHSFRLKSATYSGLNRPGNSGLNRPPILRNTFSPQLLSFSLIQINPNRALHFFSVKRGKVESNAEGENFDEKNTGDFTVGT